MLLTKRGKSHERKRNHQQSPNIRLRGTNGCGPRVNRQSQRCHTNQLCTFFKILCRSCGPVVRWHYSHRKQPRKRRLPVKPVRGTYRTILRQRTLPGEKRGRTGHCGIRLLFGEEGTYVVDSIKALLPLQFTGETMNE